MKTSKWQNPICPYCNQPSERCRGSDIYSRRPELARSTFYRCVPCKAWVGCHPGTDAPLGRLANKKLRQAKMAAHAAFDPLWRAKMAHGVPKNVARSAGYAWLSVQLGIAAQSCHIDMFDVEQCRRVVEACRPYLKADA